MSITKRGTRHYEVRVYLGTDEITGRERRVSRTIRGSRSDAREAEAELLLKARAGELTSHTTFAELAERWYAHNESGWSPRHRWEVRRTLDTRVLPYLGAKQLAKIRPATLSALYTQLAKDGVTASRVRRAHAVVSAALAQGCQWQLLTHNPARHAAPAKPRAERKPPPSAGDLARLLAHAKPDFAMFLRLAIVTGARRGEILALRWCDIDTDSIVIARALTYSPDVGVQVKDPKTHKTRRQGIDATTAQQLAEHLRAMAARAEQFRITLPEDAYLFSDEPDCSIPLHPDTISARFAKLRKTAEVSCRLHDLRHAAVSSLLAAGIDAKRVQQFAGHASGAMTMDVYGHAQPVGTELAELLAGTIDS